MKSVEVFTLADERFLPGLAGLINSLRGAGFDGRIVVGAPGPIDAIERLPDVRVVSLVDRQTWIGCLKPELLLREGRDAFVFLDADIVIGDADSFDDLQRLARNSLTLALEGLVAPQDLRRRQWADRVGLPPARPDAWAYYNSGFFAGDLERDRVFLETWDRAIKHVLPLSRGHFHDADFPFVDQDVLNAVLQSSDMTVTSLQFPDWWSAVAPLNPFLHAGGLKQTAFFHGIGKKPWELEAIPPRAPHAYEERWYRHAVLDPNPVRVDCKLPPEIQNWLSGSWSGRLVSRGTRLRQRLRGR